MTEGELDDIKHLAVTLENFGKTSAEVEAGKKLNSLLAYIDDNIVLAKDEPICHHCECEDCLAKEGVCDE